LWLVDQVDQMELLLNLFWLMLFAAAIWWWQCKRVYAQNSKYLDRLRPILLLGCIWVLLFPVVSATDDLYAMQAEVKESGQFNGIAKPSAGHKSHAPLRGASASPAQLIFVCSFCAHCHLGPVEPLSVFLHEQARTGARACRAPPLYPVSSS